MNDTHKCEDMGPPMNAGTRILKQWFGWTIEQKSIEIKINFCPFCSKNLQKDWDREHGR